MNTADVNTDVLLEPAGAAVCPEVPPSCAAPPVPPAGGDVAVGVLEPVLAQAPLNA